LEAEEAESFSHAEMTTLELADFEFPKNLKFNFFFFFGKMGPALPGWVENPLPYSSSRGKTENTMGIPKSEFCRPFQLGIRIFCKHW
jgi:hypothetical protein